MVVKKFSKLDLSHAYQQVLLDEESRDYVTINTHLGLYRYTRLPFGVAAAPAIFQHTMDQVLQGIDGVGYILDDILITGKDDAEHKRNLEATLQRLDDSDIKLKRSKCSFMQDEVEYFCVQGEPKWNPPITEESGSDFGARRSQEQEGTSVVAGNCELLPEVRAKHVYRSSTSYSPPGK